MSRSYGECIPSFIRIEAVTYFKELVTSLRLVGFITVDIIELADKTHFMASESSRLLVRLQVVLCRILDETCEEFRVWCPNVSVAQNSP